MERIHDTIEIRPCCELWTPMQWYACFSAYSRNLITYPTGPTQVHVVDSLTAGRSAVHVSSSSGITSAVSAEKLVMSPSASSARPTAPISKGPNRHATAAPPGGLMRARAKGRMTDIEGTVNAGVHEGTQSRSALRPVLAPTACTRPRST